MKIRKATINDIKKIAKIMLTEFSKPPFNEKIRLKVVLDSLASHFKIGKGLVAIADKAIVGVLTYKIEQYWEGPVILIEDFAVTEKYQKQGIGRKLMETIENLAKEKKIKSINLHAHKKSSAVKFYQKKGYKTKKDTILMEKKIK